MSDLNLTINQGEHVSTDGLQLHVLHSKCSIE